MTTKRWSA